MANRFVGGTPRLGVDLNGPPVNLRFGDTQPWFRGATEPFNTQGTGSRGVGPASLSNFNPGETIDTHITFPSNYRIPYAYMTGETYRTSGVNSSTMVDLLVIQRKQDTDTEVLKGSHRSSKKNHSLMNLAFANYILFKREILAFQESSTKKDYSSWKLTAKEICEKYYFSGIVTSETGEEKPPNQRDQFGNDRSENVIIRGRHMLVNTFGKRIHDRTRLFVILKRVDISNYQYELHPTQTLDLMQPPNKSDSDDVYDNYPFQFVPYGDFQHDYPPLEARKYEEKFMDPTTGEIVKHTCYGRVFYIGTCESNRHPDSKYTEPEHLLTSLIAILRNPKITVNFDAPIY